MGSAFLLFHAIVPLVAMLRLVLGFIKQHAHEQNNSWNGPCGVCLEPKLYMLYLLANKANLMFAKKQIAKYKLNSDWFKITNILMIAFKWILFYVYHM